MGLFKKRDNVVSVSGETIIKALVLAVLFLYLLRFLDNITHQLTLIGVAFFLAIALNPAVSRLTKMFKSKSRVLATGVAYIIVISILGGFLYLVIPPLARQTTDFAKDLPGTVEDFQQQDTAAGRFIQRYNLEDQVNEWSDGLKTRTGDLTDPILSTAGRAVGTLVSLVTVLVLTFMMLVEGPTWIDKLIALQHPSKRKERRQTLRKMYKVVTGYVNGQVIIAGISASFTLVALLIGNTVFDASVNAVALAGIIFLFALIPLIGNIIGAAILVLFTLFASTPFAIAIAIYFIVYQQIENATIQPIIQSRGNQLTPLMIFIAALLGAGLGGLLGALAAIPVAGCIKILIDEYLERKMPDRVLNEDS